MAIIRAIWSWRAFIATCISGGINWFLFAYASPGMTTREWWYTVLIVVLSYSWTRFIELSFLDL